MNKNNNQRGPTAPLTPPHRVKSRAVESPQDIARVLHDAKVIDQVFATYPNCAGIAHPQITKDDPLRFYVARGGLVVVNPEIDYVGDDIESSEGCMTFPFRNLAKVVRVNRIRLSYQQIVDGRLTEPTIKDLSGFPAVMAQHEVDHLDAIYIYD